MAHLLVDYGKLCNHYTQLWHVGDSKVSLNVLLCSLCSLISLCSYDLLTEVKLVTEAFIKFDDHVNGFYNIKIALVTVPAFMVK